MHHIDHSFLADEPESWFGLVFKHEQWNVEYSDQNGSVLYDDVYTEQVLFQYQNPWTIQIRWSKNAASVLSGVQHPTSIEPVLLEWTNILANHWACHWLRKKLAPIAPGSLPVQTEKPTRDPKDAVHHLRIALSDISGNDTMHAEIDWFLPNDITLVDTSLVPWSPNAVCVADMLPIGTIVLNEHGEVTHCNAWVKNKEPALQNKILPLPWELVFNEQFLNDVWSLYYTYQRASYCTPWLNNIDTSRSFTNGLYIVSLAPFNKGATLQLTSIPHSYVKT